MKDFKWLQKIGFFFLLGFIFCGLQACSDDEDENVDEIDYSQLIGMWQLEDSGQLNVTHIKSDGTATTYWDDGPNWSNYYNSQTYTYTLSNGQLSLTESNGNTRVFNIRTLTSSRLVMYYTPFDREITNSYKRYYGELPNEGGNNVGGDDNYDDNYNDEFLAAPTNVQASSNGGEVTITWQSVSGASVYSVWRSSSSTGSYSPLNYSVSGTSYTDYYPQAGYNYYKIKALGGGHLESDFSSYASAYVDEKDLIKVEIPKAPTGISVSNEGSSNSPRVVVRWNNVNDADEYYVYKSNYSAWSSYVKIGTIKQNSYTDYDAPTSTYSTCWYKVKAVNKAGESSYSDFVQYFPKNNDDSGSGGNDSGSGGDDSGSGGDDSGSGSGGNDSGTSSKTKLDTPTNLEYENGWQFVQISFDEVPLAYQYELYRSTRASSGYTKISASGGSDISSGRYIMTDSNPKSGTTYYKVKAIALSYLGIEDSDFSSYIKVTR